MKATPKEKREKKRGLARPPNSGSKPQCATKHLLLYSFANYGGDSRPPRSPPTHHAASSQTRRKDYTPVFYSSDSFNLRLIQETFYTFYPALFTAHSSEKRSLTGGRGGAGVSCLVLHCSAAVAKRPHQTIKRGYGGFEKSPSGIIRTSQLDEFQLFVVFFTPPPQQMKSSEHHRIFSTNCSDQRVTDGYRTESFTVKQPPSISANNNINTI